MIAIVDYGVGNLFSLNSSLAAIGADSVVTSDAEVLKKAERIILPGVGAFGDAAAKLRATGLVDLLISEAKSGKPFLLRTPLIPGITDTEELLDAAAYEAFCAEEA